MRKVCFYISTLRLGGAERVVYNLAEYLHSQGVEVSVVTTFKKTHEKEFPLSLGIKRILSEPTPEEFAKGSGNAHGFLLRIKNFQTRYRKLRKIWQEETPDLIVAFVGKNNLMAILTARGLGIPVVVSVRGNPPNEYDTRGVRLAMRVLFPKAAGIVMQTKQQMAWFPKNVQRKTVLLPNPLNPAFLRPIYQGERKPRIVTVSVMGKNKNLPMLLRAFAMVSEKYLEGSVTIYAQGPDYPALEKLAEELSIRERVFMPGEQANIPELIADASIFTMTSFTEGVPNALIEGMAMGLVPISTDCPCGGPGELIQNGVNGYLVPVDDAKALAEKLALLMGDKALRERLSSEALKVRETLNPEKVLPEWMGYFDKILSKC